MSYFAGSMFGHGMENVLKANQTWTTVGTIAFSGVTGGVVAELTGGDFWKGAAIGVTIAALNHGINHLQQNAKPWDLDGDGKLSKYEADVWYLKGNGREIFVDGKRINLKGLDASDMTYNPTSETYSLSTTKAFKELPLETAATYGGSTFKLVNGEWQMQSQNYHYNLRTPQNGRQINTFQDFKRNILNELGKPIGASFGVGKQYKIIITY